MTFDLFNVPRIVFGRGTIARLSEFVPRSSRVLLVYNGPRPKIPSTAEFHQRGEPTGADIDRALDVARAGGCDFVIGVGGGSAIDAGKAVAGLLANGGVASDYMEVVGKGQKITKPAVPWIAIPTTAGTGAEVTRNAVVGWPEKKFKASIRSDLLLPRIALIDPELALNVPPNVTASSGMDALCQCIEAYVAKNANAMTDAIAIKGIALAARYVKPAFDHGHDIEAREAMAMAALCSGMALTNAGLGAAHGLAAPLGANFPVPHGTVCGVLLPHAIDANLAAGAVPGKYADIDRALPGGLAWCRELVREFALPGLSTFGVSEADIDRIVDLAKRASSMRHNPVVLSDEALREILRQSL